MKREELSRLLEGTASPAERARLAEELQSPDEAAGELLQSAWAPGPAPDVFDAAFEEVHPAGLPWWRRLVLVAAVAAVALVAVLSWPRVGPGEAGGLKGPGATPTLGLVLVVLDGAPHRLAPDEAVAPGARLGARVTSTQPAWIALEARRDGGWVRVWPDGAAGVRVEAGERELGDELGAVVWRAEPGPGGGELRLVGATQPLDVAPERSTTSRHIEVSP